MHTKLRTRAIIAANSSGHEYSQKNGKERTHIYTRIRSAIVPTAISSVVHPQLKPIDPTENLPFCVVVVDAKKNIQDFQVTDRSRRMCMSLLVLNHSIKRPMTFTTIHCVSRISWAPNPLIFVALFNKSFYDAYDARTYAFIGEIAFDRQYRFVVLCVQFPCPICCGQGERFFFLRSF